MTTLETTPFVIGDNVTINLPNPTGHFNKYQHYQVLRLIAETEKAYQFKLDNTNYTLWLPKKAVKQIESMFFGDDNEVEVKQSKLAKWFSLNEYSFKVLYDFGQTTYTWKV